MARDRTGASARQQRPHHDRTKPVRLAALLVALVLVASACDWWAGVGYGPTRKGHNVVETELGVDEVDELAEVWSAPAPGGSYEQPSVWGGRVFLAAGYLTAYDLAGDVGCAGVPTVCEPLWTSSISGLSAVSVADGVAYATGGGVLAAFDVDGVDGCAGTPTVCEPLWTASLGAGGTSPAVVYGTVYVTSDRLYAFDADGVDGCAGTPTVCTPLWRSSTGATDAVAVGGEMAYVLQPTDGFLAAYDATDTSACSGTPLTCPPAHTYELDMWDECFPYGCGFVGPPTVADGKLLVLGEECCSMALGRVRLSVFDADGVEGCTGTPAVCGRLGVVTVDSSLPWAKPPVAVADGVVYAGASRLVAFDLATLDRLWASDAGFSSPAVADGVVHVVDQVDVGGGTEVAARAIDAAGVEACSGAPLLCDALWTSPPTGSSVDPLEIAYDPVSSPAVAEHHVVVRTDRLRVFARR